MRATARVRVLRRLRDDATSRQYGATDETALRRTAEIVARIRSALVKAETDVARAAWEGMDYGQRSAAIMDGTVPTYSGQWSTYPMADKRRPGNGVALMRVMDARRSLLRKVPTDETAQAWPYSPGADAYPVAPTLTAWADESVPAWATVDDDETEVLRRAAWHYCRAMDGRRTRNRADECADDVANDAALTLARLLRNATAWPVVAWGPFPDADRSEWIDDDDATATVRTRYVPTSWRYLSQRETTEAEIMADDDDVPTGHAVTRATLRRWAIHDGARRNGYAVKAETATDDAQAWRDGERQSEEDRVKALGGLPTGVSHVGVATLRTAHAPNPARVDAIRRALADAPTEVRTYLMHALAADGKRAGRSGALTDAAQACYGGQRGSRRIVARFADTVERQARAVIDRADVIAPTQARPTEAEAREAGMSLR